MTTVSLNLPDGIAALLDAEARAEGSNAEDVVRAAIVEHLRARRPEDLEDALALAQYRERQAQGELQTVPHESVRAQLLGGR